MAASSKTRAREGRHGFRSVLCAVDFSETSRLALRRAAWMAAHGRGVLQVLYVNDPFLMAAAAAALHDRGLARRSGRELRAFVDATVRGTRVTCHVSTGEPIAEILTAASEHGSDLIVLGTHGLSGADRLLLGSTTLGVLERTRIPTLAVPAAPRAFARRRWVGESLIAALDVNDRPHDDVDAAVQIARWFDCRLVLAHVVGGRRWPAWLKADLAPRDRIRAAEAKHLLERLAATARRRVPTTTRVLSGRIGEELAALAAEEPPRAIVTALRDRRRWFAAGRGSITYQLLAHGLAPVLAHPGAWRLP